MDRTAPESGTARSLIQTSAEALRFPAGRPKFPNLDPRSRHRPSDEVVRELVARRFGHCDVLPRATDRSASEPGPRQLHVIKELPQSGRCLGWWGRTPTGRHR